MRRTTQIIAREGWRKLSIAIVAWMVFALFGLGLFSTIALLYALYCLVVYRNPEREIPQGDEGVIVAPIDGVIESITVQESCLMVGVKKRFYEVGVIRSPLGATVVRAWKLNGLPSELTSLSQSAGIECRMGENHLAIECVATQLSREAIIYCARDEKIRTGERIGFLVQGTLSVSLPLSARLMVALDDEIIGGETIIGTLS